MLYLKLMKILCGIHFSMLKNIIAYLHGHIRMLIAFSVFSLSLKSHSMLSDTFLIFQAILPYYFMDFGFA